jgi:cytochrome c oxidase subunit 1
MAGSVAIPAHGQPVATGKNFYNAEQGIWSWLTTVDHKRIGIMYLVSTGFMFIVGGLFALALRLTLLHPGDASTRLVGPETYNQLFTLHGAIMVFLFIIPSIPGAISNFVLPIMIGAKDVAFPKLNLLSLYIYWCGAIIMLASIVLGGLDTGWTFYTPYSTTTNTNVVSMTLGVFILGFSSILTGLNFIVTIHKLRAPGIGWYELPLFLWATYATSLIQILATPVLAITLVLLMFERLFSIGIFDPTLGGDPVLFQHFFWFYSHPAVYIMILPGLGIVSELIAVHAKRKIYGYTFVAWSSVAIALLGFLVWGHHMFVSGQSMLASTLFSFITFFIAVPTGVKIFNWLATLYQGSITLNTPMIWALIFLVVFPIGGLTGIPLAMLNTNIHLTDTYFVVAHFHYVMMGGTVMAFFGGLHHWWPKMTGRMYNDTIGKVAALTVGLGFNMTFFTQFILGARGMPRRYYNYLDQFQPLHAFSTVGSWVLGLGILIAIVNLLRSLKYGEVAPANPWGGASLEWMTASPPPTENFIGNAPVAHGPYDFDKLDMTHVPGAAS